MELIENNRKIIILTCFVTFFFIGLNIFKDYGVHEDELGNQWFGNYMIQYINNPESSECPFWEVHGETVHIWIHGPVFELFLAFIEKKILKLAEGADIIFMRHLVTFLTYFTGVVFFYFLCLFYFKNWKVGLLGCLFLILHPRIFSNSFYNSVDIPFLSFYIISIYSLFKYLERKTLLRTFLHALVCAVLIDIRVAGVIMPFCTLFFVIADLIKNKEERRKIKLIAMNIILYLVALFIFIILFWPLLWKSPIHNFLFALRASLYNSGTATIFFTPVPWYYNFVWILITTPLLYSFLFVIGIVISIKAFLKNPIKYYSSYRNRLLALFLFLTPIALSIIFKTRLFCDWRHHYFIYPLFVIFILLGTIFCLEFINTKFTARAHKIIQIIFICMVILNMAGIGWLMVKYHPHQNIYKNVLAPFFLKNGRICFDKFSTSADYWGLSYRDALEYILKNDKAKEIKVYIPFTPKKFLLDILSANDGKRLISTEDPKDAKYILNLNSLDNVEYQEYYIFEVCREKLVYVYKLKN